MSTMDKENNRNFQVSDANFGQGQIQDGLPIVFLRERTLFGDIRPQEANWLKHTEMFEALSTNINASHITGLQRINGLWRIYVDNLEDKVTLLSKGLQLRGNILPLLSTNPGRLDGEQTLQVRIKDIPLSVDDGVLTRELILQGAEVISATREKLRITGKLVNCETGDRLITIKASSLKTPLKRFMYFSHFKAKVFHYGQEAKRAQKCSKCFEEGHTFKDCVNDWKCSLCMEFGHKQDSCESDLATLHNQNTDTEIPTRQSGSLDQDKPRDNSCDKPDNTGIPAVNKVSKPMSGKQAIDIMSNPHNKHKTPNKRRAKNANRSPPTPAENLKGSGKKQCQSADDEDSDSQSDVT